jgi:hypothetical protein
MSLLLALGRHRSHGPPRRAITDTHQLTGRYDALSTQTDAPLNNKPCAHPSGGSSLRRLTAHFVMRIGS